MDKDISDDLINYYITYYWQEDPFSATINILNNSAKVETGKIYNNIQKWKKTEENKKLISKLSSKYYEDRFKTRFPLTEFEKLFDFRQTEQECHYCHITLDIIDKLTKERKIFKKQITRGWTLEIDRKEANKEYTKQNSVICCY
jgi:hypothetical protein